MSPQKDNGGGLSAQTLVIASLSSLAAALVVHKFWQGGAILGAAVTPVIVALVSEALRKPAQVISAKTTRGAVEPPPVVVPERDDRFGIWEEQKKRRPRRRLHVGLAVATGLVAFLIAAFFLTGAELVLGGASDSDRFRFVPGKQQKKDSGRDAERDRDAPAQTEQEEAEPAPEEEEEAPPTVTVTAPPTETVPEDEAPPEETTPEEAPAPAPSAPPPAGP